MSGYRAKRIENDSPVYCMATCRPLLKVSLSDRSVQRSWDLLRGGHRNQTGLYSLNPKPQTPHSTLHFLFHYPKITPIQPQ